MAKHHDNKPNNNPVIGEVYVRAKGFKGNITFYEAVEHLDDPSKTVTVRKLRRNVDLIATHEDCNTYRFTPATGEDRFDPDTEPTPYRWDPVRPGDSDYPWEVACDNLGNPLDPDEYRPDLDYPHGRMARCMEEETYRTVAVSWSGEPIIRGWKDPAKK